MLKNAIFSMNFGQGFRIAMFIISIPIGVYLFSFAMEHNFGIIYSFILGFSAPLEVMTKIFYQIRRGEVEFKKLEFIKRIGVRKTEQSIIYEKIQ